VLPLCGGLWERPGLPSSMQPSYSVLLEELNLTKVSVKDDVILGQYTSVCDVCI